MDAIQNDAALEEHWEVLELDIEEGHVICTLCNRHFKGGQDITHVKAHCIGATSKNHNKKLRDHNRTKKSKSIRNEVYGLKESSPFQHVTDKKSYPFLLRHWEHKRKRPFSYEAAKIVAISQPSSAAIERVFSLYRQLFSDNQGRALADVRTLSVQLKHHDRAC